MPNCSLLPLAILALSLLGFFLSSALAGCPSTQSWDCYTTTNGTTGQPCGSIQTKCCRNGMFSCELCDIDGIPSECSANGPTCNSGCNWAWCANEQTTGSCVSQGCLVCISQWSCVYNGKPQCNEVSQGPNKYAKVRLRRIVPQRPLPNSAVLRPLHLAALPRDRPSP
jgi:hypothetical protein